MAGYRFADESGLVILSPDGKSIPADPENRHYAALIASGAEVAPFSAPLPSAADLQAEYQRRLVALLGARDLAHAAFIHADDNRELQELRAVATPSAEQTARIGELVARAAAVSALIDRYNLIPDNPVPEDYRNDELWS